MSSGHSGAAIDPSSSHKRNAPSSADVDDDGKVVRAAGTSTDGKKQKWAEVKEKKKHHDPLVLEKRRLIQACCARDDLAQAMNVYRSSLGVGKGLEPQTLYNLLNLCCGLSDRGLHVGTPLRSNNGSESYKLAEGALTDAGTPPASPEAVQIVDAETRQTHADEIMAHMRERNIPLTESCFTAMVKLFSKTDVNKAEALLNDAERTQQCGKPRLRLYSPLLLRYCELGEALSACRVWKRITASNLVLSEREYTALMECSCRTRSSALMERVLSDMSEEVMVPCRDFRLAVIEWFRSPAAVSGESSHRDEDSVASLLQEIPLPYTFAVDQMGPVVDASAPSWLLSEGCLVDSDGRLQSGCLAGSCLLPVETPSSLWEELQRMNEAIVLSGRVNGEQSAFQGGRKGPKTNLDEAAVRRRRQLWEDFNQYLEPPNSAIDVMIDGANVGYYETNYAGAPKHVDYDQIDRIVQHFVKSDQKVLVFLNARHVSSPLLPPHAEPIVASWRATNVLYTTPRGMNDDWFWLHAAFVKRSLVVTNDEMRDHHFQMLAQRGFVRWKDRHQVHFRFGARNADNRHRLVELTYPDAYSRRMQRVGDGLVIPMPKRGDENRFLDGVRFDETSPVEETYLCIRPNVTSR